MAITPAKFDMKDFTSRGKVYVWFTPTISAGGDTITVPIKRLISLEIGNRPATTFTSTAASNGAGTTFTITVTASCTSTSTIVTPLVIYGQ